MTAYSLVLRDVLLQRGGRVLVSEANIEARAGELIALRGQSGSGKTTILRAIAGLDGFDAGAIEVGQARLEAGRAPDRAMLHALRRSVGLVFQFHCLFEHMSALQNVCLSPVHVYRKPAHEAAARARDLFKQLGVETRADALPRELSGGEAQRVAIARALAVDPPVLLMDEPTASLDATRRLELAALLRRLVGRRRTLLIATHDEDFAAASGSRVLRLDCGAVHE